MTGFFAKICHPTKRAFLTAYSQTGNKSRAAKIAGISNQAIYTARWREDEEFQDALETARVMAGDVLEAEAFRRAVTGTRRFTGWYQGKPGGVVREYSDVLLIFLLKGALPDRYADRVKVDQGLRGIDLRRLPDDLLARIADGENVMAVLASASKELGRTPAALLGVPRSEGDSS